MVAGGSTYRADIDGLRAVAVGAVVLHHASPGLVPGGYIGVDVFFVISGYLIGRMLLEEYRGNGISLRNFYHRRILRIIPAYYTAILVTYIFGVFLLMPTSLEILAVSAQESLIFISNFWFSNRVDYFDEASSFQFLLHTWSLSVEEQF